jgi:hypothetical protein
VVLSGLESGVGNLAVVNDEGVTLGAALLIGPTNALGEASIGVGEEELENQSISNDFQIVKSQNFFLRR